MNKILEFCLRVNPGVYWIDSKRGQFDSLFAYDSYLMIGQELNLMSLRKSYTRLGSKVGLTAQYIGAFGI